MGTSTAYVCLTRDSARAIALYDVKKPKVAAEVLDLAHGAALTGASEVQGGANPRPCSRAPRHVGDRPRQSGAGQARLDLAATNVALLNG